MLVENVTYNGISVTEHGRAIASEDGRAVLAVWREASRHVEIGPFIMGVTEVLSAHLPLAQVLVRRVDLERSCLDTVAAGRRDAELLGNARTECSSAQMSELLAWCRKGAVAWGERGPRGPLGTAVPAGIRGQVLAGPLGGDGSSFGVLVLASAPGKAFDQQHAVFVESLLEPLSIALENDRRLHEMAAMRAAAEADKRSLLTRLGRKELGDTVVGAEAGLRGVMDRVELVSRSDVPVLILGETGTGKELIARLIHARSSRNSGPFLRINCGAIPPELIDSQLFGHERGAFTGAVESRQGWFERADGGTLLLDEIGELPLAAQVRLLRILQDGWLERVGGHQPIHVDVRIVAATHRDLATMVAEGRFREDLWYRIAVFPIRLPPLRERCEDIASLARHFAERAAARFVLPLALPTPDDIELLMTYHWPGNIRELAAVIDRAAILGDGRSLEIAKALGVSLHHAVPSTGGERPDLAPPAAPAQFLSLDAAMKQHIEAALAITKGRIEGRRGAAALLKINPHTLRARMRKLHIAWAEYRPADDLY